MSGEVQFAIILDVIRCLLLSLTVVYAFFSGPITRRRYQIMMVIGGSLIFWGGFLDLTDEIPSLNGVAVLGAGSPHHEHIKDTFGYIPGLVLFAFGLISNTRELRRLDRQKINAYERLLPICCACDKIRIRDSEGGREVWCTLEAYIRNRETVEFTHTFCPECLEKQYRKMRMQERVRDEGTVKVSAQSRV